MKKQSGQMAIFIAMIFQVLFVLFAMAINVALVVHDKINLQNSVDLAAYYAAQKQAEMLNVMAHQNYQIRQSWKLLAWRYRVLGTMGLESPRHPVKTGSTANSAFLTPKQYVICVTYKPTWEDVPDGENLCKKPTLNIPPLPRVKVIAGFLGLNAAIAVFADQLRAKYDKQCAYQGAFNSWFGMSIMHAYRLDQANRRRVIYAVAKNLQGRSNGDFTDLDGQSVRRGAENTLRKNLTWANDQPLSYQGMEMHNSLKGIKREQWLSDIEINPTLLYMDSKEGEGCQGEVRPIQDSTLRRAEANRYLESHLNGKKLKPWSSGEPPTGDVMHMSLGVEKNPWYMVYVGIKASTAPRQLFFPIGPPVQMTARAYAKPFGGRIGPWFSESWPKNSLRSEGQQVDRLSPPRTQQNGLLDSPDDPTRLPNYSRYPGDPLGLTSNLGLNDMRGLASVVGSYNHFRHIIQGFDEDKGQDILSWNHQYNSPSPFRKFELAAIAPDLFDITYYSIEPHWDLTFRNKLLANRTRLKIPGRVEVRPDLGGEKNSFPTFSVIQQMNIKPEGTNIVKREAFYKVRDKAHLLTAWVPGDGILNYSFSKNLFGKCARDDDDLKVKNPGACIAGGGRFGYSVKVISRNALKTGHFNIGGDKEGPSTILNPPPSDSVRGW